MTATATATGTEARVCQLIAARQQMGVSKYGTTVSANPLVLREWLQHGRQYLGCELNPTYGALQTERIEKETTLFNQPERLTA